MNGWFSDTSATTTNVEMDDWWEKPQKETAVTKHEPDCRRPRNEKKGRQHGNCCKPILGLETAEEEEWLCSPQNKVVYFKQ